MGSATQYTVNNQMVNATLMNIADNPTKCVGAGEGLWTPVASIVLTPCEKHTRGIGGMLPFLCAHHPIAHSLAHFSSGITQNESCPALTTAPTPPAHVTRSVQLPGVYKQEEIPRVPVVCTGNDFSTLYAPLIRDGRMEKFYWAPTREVGDWGDLCQACTCLAVSDCSWQSRQRVLYDQRGSPPVCGWQQLMDLSLLVWCIPPLPLPHFWGASPPSLLLNHVPPPLFTRQDRVGVCNGIFQHDDVNLKEIEKLVDAFPGQSIDFFGALRARVYDDKVREWISGTGIEAIGKRLVNSREGKVTFDKPMMTLDVLMKYGNALVGEQENVKRVQLAESYMSGAALAGSTGSSHAE